MGQVFLFPVRIRHKITKGCTKNTDNNYNFITVYLQWFWLRIFLVENFCSTTIMSTPKFFKGYYITLTLSDGWSVIFAAVNLGKASKHIFICYGLRH